MQHALESGGRSAAALGTVAADFQSCDGDVKAAFPLNLAFEPVEKVAFEFGDLAAAQAGHVNVVTRWAAFVEVFFSLHVHQVEFIN